MNGIEMRLAAHSQTRIFARPRLTATGKLFSDTEWRRWHSRDGLTPIASHPIGRPPPPPPPTLPACLVLNRSISPLSPSLLNVIYLSGARSVCSFLAGEAPSNQPLHWQPTTDIRMYRYILHILSFLLFPSQIYTWLIAPHSPTHGAPEVVIGVP